MKADHKTRVHYKNYPEFIKTCETESAARGGLEDWSFGIVAEGGYRIAAIFKDRFTIYFYSSHARWLTNAQYKLNRLQN